MRISQLDRSITLAGILLLGLLAMTARPATDPDLWWHLRTGQWIMETGHIPHVDPFSFTRPGSPWVCHEWLSEVVFFEVWKHAGQSGLIIFSALVTTAGFMLLYLRSAGSPQWAVAAVTVGALAAAPTWGVRPQMFTFALASLLLWLLGWIEQKPLLLFLIPPVFLLWLNLHAGFALGPVLLLAFGAGLAWEGASGETPWTDVRPQLMRLFLAFAVCAALVPLNPSGSHLYRYPLEVLRSAGMRSFINEWHPPDFHQLRYLPVFLIWVALLRVLTGSRRPRARVLAPLFLMFLAAVDAVRHIPLFVLTAIPVIAAAGPAVSSWRRFTPRLTIVPNGRLRLGFRIAVLLLMTGFTLVRWTVLARRQSQTEAEQFPQRAMEVLLSHPTTSRLFAYYDWGGYAIWKLYPRQRIFIDGRADLYGDDLLHQFQQAAELKAGWQRILDQWGVDAVLVPPSAGLAQGLFLDPRWHAEYQDSQAVLFLPLPQSAKPSGSLPK